MKPDTQSKTRSPSRNAPKVNISSEDGDLTGDLQVVSTTLVATPPPHTNRQQLIEQAAYHHAEARGFEPGGEVDDWLAAEAEVDARLRNEGAV